MKNIKKHPYLFALSIIFMALGISLIFVDTNSIMQVIFVIMGIMCIFHGLFAVLSGQTLIGYLYGLLYLVMGILLFFNQQGVIMIITIVFASVSIVLPIIRIILENDKLRQFKTELPALVLAFAILFLGIPVVFKYVLVALLFGLGVTLMVLVFYHKDKLSNSQKRNAIDV